MIGEEPITRSKTRKTKGNRMKTAKQIKSGKYYKAKTDKNGYIALVRCGMNHSGNHLLSGPVNGHYSCCGCSTFFPAAKVIEAQERALAGKLGGDVGNMGLIARH